MATFRQPPAPAGESVVWTEAVAALREYYRRYGFARTARQLAAVADGGDRVTLDSRHLPGWMAPPPSDPYVLRGEVTVHRDGLCEAEQRDCSSIFAGDVPIAEQKVVTTLVEWRPTPGAQ